MIDLAPLLYIYKAMEPSLLLLIWGLLLAIPVISMISSISCVDLPIVLLLLQGPLAMWFKESCLGLRGINAYVSDCKQISHGSRLLHGDLINSLDVTHPIAKGIDDLDVLDIRDSIPGIAKRFHVVLQSFIMLLLDGLQGLSSRWMLICTLEVPDEYGTQLVLGVDGSLGQIDRPWSGHTGQYCG
jgi:hypothetical protein